MTPVTAGWPVSRTDVRGPADITVAMLSINALLNAIDVVLDCLRPWPGSLALLWLIVTVGTGASFLTWFWRARTNTARYGPGRVTSYPDWTIAGWACPVAWFWIPYQVTSEVLAASAQPSGGSPARPGAARRPAAPLRTWWALWLGTWIAWWALVICLVSSWNHGVTRALPQLLSLAFDLLGLGGAGCAIAIVVIITRLQAQRAAEPAFPPSVVPRAGPPMVLWLLVLCGIVLAPVLLLLTVYAVIEAGLLIVPCYTSCT
jgi:hypothetical protein